MTECNGCGACCSPVPLAFTKAEAAVAPDIWPRDRYWVAHELTPISRREAKRRAPWLFEGEGAAPSDSGEPQLLFFYDCVHFDAESGRCRDWENRPATCRGFPWYGGLPRPRAELAPSCSFNADIGRPVEFLPRRSADDRR